MTKLGVRKGNVSTILSLIVVSFFIATMKPAKQRSGKQRKARLLSYVKKSWDMTLTLCTSGRSYKICQREVIRDAWRKMSLNPNVLYAWQCSGWSE